MSLYTPVAAAAAEELGEQHDAAEPAAANAHAPRNLAAAAADLGLPNLRRAIDDPTWLGRTPPEFRSAEAILHYHWGGTSEGSGFSTPQDTPTSSMAVSTQMQASVAGSSFPPWSFAPSRNLTIRTPSLGPCSTIKSESSIRTSRAESGVEFYGFDVDEDGALLAPEEEASDDDETFACLFDFLDCHYESRNVEEWDTHCKSHLRGQLPEKVECPFACGWKKCASSGEAAWSRRMQHIVNEHRGQRRNVAMRPEVSLLDHMLRCDVISRAVYKELRLHGRVRDGFVYTTASGPVEDRRRERRERGSRRR